MHRRWLGSAAHSFGVLLLLAQRSHGASPLPNDRTIVSQQQQQQQVQRRTEDQAAAFEWDLTGFGVRFERCQYVKMFDDELAEDEDATSVLALNHFVVYKLCPSDECDSCIGVHGEYVMDVQDYLQAIAEYQMQAFEYMCENCNDNSNEGCAQQCYEYDNLEANGYVDATEYMECQRLEGGDDDGGAELFVGPRCSETNNEISIGLFSDEDCSVPYYDEDVEDVLGVKLSYLILQSVHTSDDDGGKICLSCKEADDDEQNNANDQADYDDVNEMCENVYSASGKCESIYGLEIGFVQMNREDGDYENQVENEFMVCNFIDSLVLNSYTETGEINVVDEQDVVYRTTTPLQKGVLTTLTVTAVALAGYAWYLHKKIDTMTPKVQLSAQADKEVI